MKKFVTIVAVMLFVSLPLLRSQTVLEKFHKKYQNDSFTEVNISGMMFEFISEMMEEDFEKEMMESFKGLKMLVSKSPKPQYVETINKMLSENSYQEMMTVKEDGNDLGIYVIRDRDKIKDLVIMAVDDSEFMIIQIVGLFKDSDLKKIAKTVNIDKLDVLN